MKNKEIDTQKYLRDPWFVATGSSWRRIITRSGEPVCVPTNHHADGHPDLQAEPTALQLMSAAPELYESNLKLLEVVKCLIEGREVTDIDKVISFAEKAKSKAEEPIY